MSTSSKLVKMDFKPGVFRESTQYAEKGAWYDVDKVRFRAGKPENIRGYETRVSATFDGNARDLVTFADNRRLKRAVFGTEKKLFEHDGDRIVDITPVSVSVTLPNAFSCAISVNTITVSATAHGRSTGDFVFFTSSTTIGGNVTLGNSVFPVSVISNNTFAIDVATTTSAAQASGSQATAHFLLETGAAEAVAGLGFGAGVYNAGVCASNVRAWNQPTSTGSSDFVSEITQWSLDNFGEDVIAVRRGGTIYRFDTDASASPERAFKVSGATNSTPTTVTSIIVSPNDRHLICLGSNAFNTTSSPTGTFDPMTVRWSNQEDITNWVPSTSSTSGETVLTDGTKIQKLDVETINSYEFGYKGQLSENLFLDANAYYNQSDNFISPLRNIADAANGNNVEFIGDQPIGDVVEGSTGSFILTYLNFGNVDTYGLDIGVNYYFNDNFRTSVNYSYFGRDLDTNDLNNDGNLDGQVLESELPINTPNHKFSLGLHYNKGKFYGAMYGRYVQKYDNSYTASM